MESVTPRVGVVEDIWGKESCKLMDGEAGVAEDLGSCCVGVVADIQGKEFCKLIALKLSDRNESPLRREDAMGTA